MELTFTKMSGAGNDFVMLNNLKGEIVLDAEGITRLCDRHFGVGADGLMLLEPPTSGDADFRMAYFNADGSSADMCGNGARCFARYAQREGRPRADRLVLETGAGLVTAALSGDRVTIQLTAPRGLELDRAVVLADGQTCRVHSCNTGVPHAVIFVEEADGVDVAGLGRELRFHEAFAPAGTNVNFVEVMAHDAIRVRTYERGVEGETLACGTGVTASAILSHRVRGIRHPVHVRVQGGDVLLVDFEDQGTAIENVRLTGPAEFVFEGRIVVG
jgi:diaminopimelate epimerase